ncbi:MAG: hypothetical protein JW838_01970 [Spirochaetes bacterium]|nr:hypothetical protein [Spirochaetota bacterium]
MLRKNTVIHIMSASSRILFNIEDAEIIRFMLDGATETQANRCYRAFICEILRQCAP